MAAANGGAEAVEATPRGPATAPEGRDLVIGRTFAAPRELAFEAWTDARQLAGWWGPECFTNPLCELDARPGGAIRIHMRGPDGMIYPMTGAYREVVAPERLVFTTAALDEDDQPLFVVLNTATFAEQGGGTTLTLRARILSATSAAAKHLNGMEQGWNQTLDRFVAFITSAQADDGGMTMNTAKDDGFDPGSPDREIVVVRSFGAPRALVFDAWTDPVRVGKWWGPNGFTTTTSEMDVRPGGTWRFVMHGPDGTDYDNRVVFVEVERPARLVYLHGSDRDDDPEQFRVTATFEEQGGGTLLTLRMVARTPEQRDRMIEFGAVEGGKQTLDRLAEHLATTT